MKGWPQSYSSGESMALARSHGVRITLTIATVAAIAGCAVSSLPGNADLSGRFDVLITDGQVLDGSGAPAMRADVAIRDGRIVEVSATPLDVTHAAKVIRARGLVVAPGFIDLHAHIEPLLDQPAAESKVRQGVTLALGGPDGGGPAGFSSYLDSVASTPLGTNVAYLAGHGSIRRAVMGTANRAPTAAELSQMSARVGDAMRVGAFGLSTGLLYVPGTYANTDEVVALAAVAGAAGGIYTSHLRAEGLGLLEGVSEAMEIGRRAKIPVVLTHHKAVGKAMWGKSVVTLAMVDSARRAGTDVMIDQYPYTASYTGLGVLVPSWAQAGGDSALARRMREPALRDSILRGVVNLLETDRGGGDLARVQFADVPWDRSLEGKTLKDLALRRGVGTTSEAAAPLVVDGVLRGGAGMVYHVMDETDVQRIMRHPMTMIASDGALATPGVGVPHPRAYGTFPRVIGRYTRDLRILTLPQAVRKMTAMPAARLGLTDRGCLRAGCVADVVVFDAERVSDVGTFTDPHHYPVGIPWVLVNGVPVVADGAMTTARPGMLLRHTPVASR
jgi:N-acyl-D-aspartate/D-glutamate deacylase